MLSSGAERNVLRCASPGSFDGDDDFYFQCQTKAPRARVLEGLAWTWTIVGSLVVIVWGFALLEQDPHYVGGYHPVEVEEAVRWLKRKVALLRCKPHARSVVQEPLGIELSRPIECV